ncbi:glucoamylase family protein [Fulvivirgaceae bacterium BMA12]|uniref:Glucoamylase family protein n=1 Tax=Agaribacillus aureus TaxID=3051825 RepID=A0ABT8L3L6_9BACT|nr:glucoamylase family protein [Fulvivirgaceae bacterium BMA12]
MTVNKLSVFLVLAGILLGCKENDPDIRNLELMQIFVGSMEIDNNGTSEDLPVDRNISLVFSNPIDQSTAASAISLRDEKQTVDINLNFSSQDKNIVVSPIGPLGNNTVYTLSVSNLLKGAGGQHFETREISFKTVLGELTILSAHIDGIDVTNQNTAINIPPDFEMIFDFSIPVDKSSFESAAELSGPDAAGIDIAFSNNDQTIRVTASNDLNYLAKYEFTLAESLTGASGEGFSTYSLNFYTSIDPTPKFPLIPEEELLTLVQQQTFKYFWDFGHPVSGLTRERNTSGETVTSGGSGFGLMAIIVGIERGFVTRAEGTARLEKIVNFLGDKADRFHGAWSHWLNGTTGDAVPFSQNDDGGDLVETAFMAQGLIAVRQYLDANDPAESSLIDKINNLLETIEWSWYTQKGQNVLYWHWSPNFDWEKNHRISGYNEALIVYILAAGSPTFPIAADVYHQGWARNGDITNGNNYLGINLPLGFDFGGPLFFAHYSFLGLDPRNLSDQYANYWEQNVNHSLINREWCISNPNNYVGYSADCWGLTASDNHEGYSAHSPGNDLGVITPTAAISSIPYTPEYSIDAIEHFYYILGDRLWGTYGFYDAFNFTREWVADSFLAIDQGPIIIMIENHRSGLIWNLFMSAPEVQSGLTKLGFTF